MLAGDELINLGANAVMLAVALTLGTSARARRDRIAMLEDGRGWLLRRFPLVLGIMGSREQYGGNEPNSSAPDGVVCLLAVGWADVSAVWIDLTSTLVEVSRSGPHTVQERRHMADISSVLVIGATGTVGRHVVAGLRRADVGVRAFTRAPDQALLGDDVEVVMGDLTQPDAVAAATNGVDAVFLLWPSFSTEQVDVAVDALTSGDPYVVYLSAAALQGPPGRVVDGIWSYVEAAVERAVSRFTFVRAGGFAANTLQWADQIRAGDVVRIPFPAAGRSLVHERDIADVAVAALTAPGHAGRSYAVTGPETLTQADQVQIIGDAIGRELRAEDEPLDETRRSMSEVFGDPSVVESSIAYWSSLVDTPERVSDDVEKVTGRPALTLRQWAADHADDFR